MKPKSLSFSPAITLAANLAKGTPIVFETNGTVLDALGLTSITKSSSSLTANWIFISPRTSNFLASAFEASAISLLIFSLNEKGGMTHALSPE